MLKHAGGADAMRCDAVHGDEHETRSSSITDTDDWLIGEHERAIAKQVGTYMG